LIFIFVLTETLPTFTQDMLPWGPVGLVLAPRSSQVAALADRLAWAPSSGMPRFSVVPLVAGTLKVACIALLLAVPLGLGAAIYTAEFAPPRLRLYLKPWIELLAGLPSVVLGFLALVIVATYLQRVFGFAYRLNVAVAGVAVALATVPLVYAICDDAIRSVPRAIRDGSLALGATRAQTVMRAVLPAACPGIVGAMLVAFGRAVGETMIVLMVAGNAPLLSFLPGVPTRTLASTIATEMGEVAHGDLHYTTLFFCGSVLLLVTVVTNLVIEALSARQRELLRRQ